MKWPGGDVDEDVRFFASLSLLALVVVVSLVVALIVDLT